MKTAINYEDNIFFAHSLIHTLKAGLELEIENDYFGDKVVEDILFLDRTLSQLYEQLNKNHFLIRRTEMFRKLLHASSALLNVLQRCLEGSLNIAATARSRLRTCRGEQQAILDAILSELRQDDRNEVSKDVVSSAEFEFLLRDEPTEGGGAKRKQDKRRKPTE